MLKTHVYMDLSYFLLDIILISEWANFEENYCTQVPTRPTYLLNDKCVVSAVCQSFHARTAGLLLKYFVRLIRSFLKNIFLLLSFWSLLLITAIILTNIMCRFNFLFVLCILILTVLSLSFANPVSRKYLAHIRYNIIKTNHITSTHTIYKFIEIIVATVNLNFKGYTY